MASKVQRPAHSPLGASGAERWMNCPGSVSLLKELHMAESDEPDYRREGTAMHLAAAHCLEKGLDTWEIVGQTFNDTEITAEFAANIQLYLDTVRAWADGAAGRFVELAISSPVHPDFYGTCDVGLSYTDKLRIVDLKGGEGIIVEPEENPQLKYYAFGFLDHLEAVGLVYPDETPMGLAIVQPRGFHVDGPVREWWTTVGEIKEWTKDTLVPAMFRAEVDHSLEAGPWCRFCPAKLVCPLLNNLFRAAATANPKEIVNVSNEALGMTYQYREAVRFYLKALDEEVFRRLNLGTLVPGTKLVQKKANRVYKDGAAKEAAERFGDDAFTKPELKSPAELEKVGAAAKAFVREHAYTPMTGLTVALASDPKPGVEVKSNKDTFAAVVEKLNGVA